MELSSEACVSLDQYVAAFAVEHRLPSLILGVSHHGAVVNVATACADGHAAPSIDTAYRIASMTKSFTAAAILKLRDSGALRLDDAIVDLAPELAAVQPPTDDAARLTVRHLLSMSGGMASDDPWGDRYLDADDTTMDRLIADGARFATSPGTRFVYSNYGYAMLGRIIAKVSGMPYQRFITQELLTPLNLVHTTWTQPDNAATAYRHWADDYRLEPVLADGGFAAMAGLWSTVGDLSAWCGWLSAAFPARSGNDNDILLRSSRREMQQVTTVWKPIVESDEAGPRVRAGGYGFGLNVGYDTRLGDYAEHSGGLPGFGSNMRWLPARQTAVVALSNLTYARVRLATLGALDLLLACDALPRPWRPPGSELDDAVASLLSLLNDWSDAEAHRVFSFNVELDDDFVTRADAAARVRNEHGRLSLQSVDVVNSAEADAKVVAADGSEFTLAVMLSPESRVTIQWYELTPVVT